MKLMESLVMVQQATREVVIAQEKLLHANDASVQAQLRVDLAKNALCDAWTRYDKALQVVQADFERLLK